MTRANLYFIVLVLSSLRVRLDFIYFMYDPFIRMSNFHTIRIIRRSSITKTDNHLEYQTCIFILRIPIKKRQPPRISDLKHLIFQGKQLVIYYWSLHYHQKRKYEDVLFSNNSLFVHIFFAPQKTLTVLKKNSNKSLLHPSRLRLPWSFKNICRAGFTLPQLCTLLFPCFFVFLLHLFSQKSS